MRVFELSLAIVPTNCWCSSLNLRVRLCHVMFCCPSLYFITVVVAHIYGRYFCPKAHSISPNCTLVSCDTVQWTISSTLC